LVVSRQHDRDVAIQSVSYERRYESRTYRSLSGIVSGPHFTAAIPYDEREARNIFQFSDRATAFFDEFFTQLGQVLRSAVLAFRNKINNCGHY
jgi:hypothetical protein